MDAGRGRELLIQYAAVLQFRNDRVHTAYVSGVGKSEISRLTGIAGTTIDRVIESAADGPERGPRGGEQVMSAGQPLFPFIWAGT